jgi:hypothetical protein
MNKKLKLYLILGTSIIMIAWWAALFFTGTKEETINYIWQVGMGLCALLYATLGIITAAKWNWLKSGVGKGIFFISLALLCWSIGQLGWSYFLFAEPNVQAPQSHLLDIIDFAAIPLWFAGILMLSKATGARYGLKKLNGQILVFLVSVIMILLSYYFLVEVARGGSSYFDQPFWKAFFDLGYSIGDAIIATVSIAIFALSWKMLGGRFKLPITIILGGFILLYFADFSFSYFDGKNEYYNGDVVDLLFMLAVTTLGIGVNMLDPTHLRKAKQKAVPEVVAAQATPDVPAEAPVEATEEPLPEQVSAPITDAQPDVSQEPAVAETEQTTPVETPDFLKVNPTAPYANPHDNSERDNQ